MRTFVGTDIIEVERIENAMQDSKFAIKVFTDNEIKYCEGKGDKTKYQHYAARFAAKEAVFKAISAQLEDKYDVSWKNIEIVNDENGRPRVNFIGVELAGVQVDVSLSHIQDYAIANAVAVAE